MGEPAPPVTLGRRPKPREGRPSAPRPTVSRRREVSHASARSLLMTVLGEYALPRDNPVWTSMLVEVLGILDIEEKSARQAPPPPPAAGWGGAGRGGRRGRGALAPPPRRPRAQGAGPRPPVGRG